MTVKANRRGKKKRIKETRTSRRRERRIVRTRQKN